MTRSRNKDQRRAGDSVVHVAGSVEPAAGSIAVREFYDRVGWVADDGGVPDDTRRFGAREAGDLKAAGHRARVRRIAELITSTASGRSFVDLVECGCGGNPAIDLLQNVCRYTGVDFSRTGLDLAEQRLGAAGIEGTLVQADLTKLPFADASFDIAYSAHALYHIPDAAAQAAAIQEIMRVLRPGGVAILVLANPRPLLFPARLLRRLIADLPVIGSVVNKLRTAGPLPYLPMPLGWMKRRLKPNGRVDIASHAIASVWVNQRVSERSAIGRLIWRMFNWLERSHPKLSARLGNFVLITAHKHVA